MINLDKFLNVEALMESFPLPLPGAIKRSIVKSIPFLLKKHKVVFHKVESESERKGVVDVALASVTDSALDFYTVQAEKDGQPIRVLVLMGKKAD